MLDEIFGDLLHKDDSLTDGQMAARALIAFLLTIALIRLAGRRSFGLRSPFDTVISLLLGATLSRGIAGASSFSGTLEASIILVVLHRLLAYASSHSSVIGHFVSGKVRLLYENGQFNRVNMNAMLVSEQDILEAIRLKENKETLDGIQMICIERTGEISIVKKVGKLVPYQKR